MIKLPLPLAGNRGRVLMVRWDEEGYQWVDIGLVPGLSKSESTAVTDTDVITITGFTLTSMVPLIIMVNGAFQKIADFQIIAPDQLRGLLGNFPIGTKFMVGQLENLIGREEIDQPADSPTVFMSTMMIADLTRCLIFLNGTLQPASNFTLVSPVAIQSTFGNVPAGSHISILQFSQMEREDVILPAPSEFVNLTTMGINYITQCLIWVNTIFQEGPNFTKITMNQIKGSMGVMPAGTLVTVIKLE